MDPLLLRQLCGYLDERAAEWRTMPDEQSRGYALCLEDLSVDLPIIIRNLAEGSNQE